MKVLILTVGTSRDPLETSILEHAPQKIVLIASQNTLDVAGQIVKDYQGSLEGHYTVTVDDPESLEEVYQKAQTALKKALEWDANEILADLTGGTKPMTAGLVLALSGRGVVFSYVGGTRREEGTGRVLSGHERVRTLQDPTTRYALREWEAFVRHFNALSLPAALAELDQILQRPISPSETRFFKALRGVVEGLLLWDRFRHEEALSRFEAHLPIALAVAEARGEEDKVRVLRGLEEALEGLRAIVNGRGRPSFALLADLLANADRRAQVGRFDDALARLYRGLELAAQADLYERLGLDLKDPSTFPKELPQDLRERAEGARGLMEVLDLAFDLATKYGEKNTLAQRLFSDARGRLKPFLDRRNESILAHGTRPVSKEEYQKFRAYFQEMGLKALPPWPTFDA